MSILESAIGWLAPPHCLVCGEEGLAVCVECFTTGITPFGARCWHCDALSKGGRTCPKCRYVCGPSRLWITTVYETISAELVHLYKFGQLRAAAIPMVDMMARTFLNFNDPETTGEANYLVVPVPTATSRARQRGFDHSALLAKLLSQRLGLQKACALGRLGQARQFGAPRAQRLSQQTDNYFVRHASLVVGRNILLVDDVLTTGGTIIAATKALRAAGARSVDALVFAKKL